MSRLTDSRRARLRAAALAVATVLAIGLAPAVPASAEPGVEQLKRQAAALRAELDRLEGVQDVAVELYITAQDALLQATTGQVAATTEVIDSRRAAAATADAAAQRVRALYQSGGPMGLTATVLQSRSLDDALVRWQAVDDAVGAIVQRDAETAGIQQAAVLRRQAAEVAAGRNRALTAARQLATERAAAAVTAAIATERALIARTDAKVVALVEQQRQQAEAAATARAATSAIQLGLGGVTDAAGRGLEGPTAANQQLPNVPAPNPVAAAAVAAAATRVGMPYVWGATGPTSFDCSGLLLWAYAQAGVPLPRTSRQQYAGLPRIPLSELAPGDLVFYATDVTQPTTISHVSMYVGNGLSVYAPRTGSFVKIGPTGYGRIIGAARPTLGR